MKRVFRSCIDPLPRFLSTRTLAFVVAFVVLGTALSVHEYLQSGREPAQAWPRSTVRAAPSAPSSTPGTRPTLLGTADWSIDEVEFSAPVEASSARGTAKKPATLFRPDDSDATGT